MARERRTLQQMLELHCRERHGGAGLCTACGELWAYAQRRLDLCVFADEKPTCAVCPIHCYEASMRERVRDVMRWAGPRMLAPHPILTILHLIDARRPLSPKAEAIRARKARLTPGTGPAAAPGRPSPTA